MPPPGDGIMHSEEDPGLWQGLSNAGVRPVGTRSGGLAGGGDPSNPCPLLSPSRAISRGLCGWGGDLKIISEAKVLGKAQSSQSCISFQRQRGPAGPTPGGVFRVVPPSTLGSLRTHFSASGNQTKLLYKNLIYTRISLLCTLESSNAFQLLRDD